MARRNSRPRWLVTPRCVRCSAPRSEHADIDPATAPEGVCPRFDPPAPRWLTTVTRALSKLTEEQR
jgi:hypothetical protein